MVSLSPPPPPPIHKWLMGRKPNTAREKWDFPPLSCREHGYSHACCQGRPPRRQLVLVSERASVGVRARLWKWFSPRRSYIYSVLFSGWFRLKARSETQAKSEGKRIAFCTRSSRRVWWTTRSLARIRSNTRDGRRVANRALATSRVKCESCAVKISREKSGKDFLQMDTYTNTVTAERTPFRMNQ